MRRGITVLVSMVSLLWQVGAHAATDWDAKLRAEFQRARTSTSIAALGVSEASHLNRDMTLMLAKARAHWGELSLETQTLASAWMLRPTEAGNSFEAPWLYGSASESTLPTTHFRIHFINKDDALYASDVNAATQSFVTSVAGILEDVWFTEHGTLGYAAVPSDLATANNGGDEKYDVYLTNLGPYGNYGYVMSEYSSNEAARPYGATSYMVLDNDYAEYFYSDPVLPLKVTVAHEYFHAIQFGYSYVEDGAFSEQTATWMEDIVYPDVHDNYQYLGEVYTDNNGNGQYSAGDTYVDRNGNGQRDSGSPNYPEAPLDAFNEPKQVQYGRFVWIHYLAQNYSDSLIRTVWETCSQIPGDTYSAINTVLQVKGSSLARAFQDFASWGYDKGAFTDGANYPLVWVDRTQSGTSVSFSSADSPALLSISGATPQLHLSTVYSQILNPSGSYSFNSSRGIAALTVLVDTGTGSMQHDVVSLNSGDGIWTAPSGALKAIVVISNVSTVTDGMSWSIASGVATTKKKSGGGGEIDGWFALLLAASSVIGYRRRVAVGKAPFPIQTL